MPVKHLLVLIGSTLLSTPLSASESPISEQPATFTQTPPSPTADTGTADSLVAFPLNSPTMELLTRFAARPAIIGLYPEIVRRVLSTLNSQDPNAFLTFSSAEKISKNCLPQASRTPEKCKADDLDILMAQRLLMDKVHLEMDQENAERNPHRVQLIIFWGSYLDVIKDLLQDKDDIKAEKNLGNNLHLLATYS